MLSSFVHLTCSCCCFFPEPTERAGAEQDARSLRECWGEGGLSPLQALVLGLCQLVLAELNVPELLVKEKSTVGLPGQL